MNTLSVCYWLIGSACQQTPNPVSNSPKSRKPWRKTMAFLERPLRPCELFEMLLGYGISDVTSHESISSLIGNLHRKVAHRNPKPQAHPLPPSYRCSFLVVHLYKPPATFRSSTLTCWLASVHNLLFKVTWNTNTKNGFLAQHGVDVWTSVNCISSDNQLTQI